MPIYNPENTEAIYCGPEIELRDWRNLPIAELTRGERVCRFVEGHCIIPEGSKMGQPVVLADFQEMFCISLYDNPAITDTAMLSIARKNAKTGTIAFILIAHLVGPEAVQNSRIVSGAMSREQAAEVYNLASKCVAISPKLRDKVRAVPSGKKLIGLLMNVEYQAISAEGKTAHGKSPILAILDEVGQIRGPQSDFVDAVTTAQGAYDNPLLIYISTQAATDADLFSIAIDDAKQYKPAKTVCHVYCASPEADPLDEDEWRKANPALGLFRSENDMRKQAEKASRMPSFENTFRNLNLNQRVDTSSPFVARSIWESCRAAPEPLMGQQAWGGLDLSARTDLTAFVLVYKEADVWQVMCRFWTPEKGLKDRSKRDRVPYDVWVREGWMQTTPGATVDYEFVAREIAELLDDADIQGIGYDRWRIDLMKKEFEDIGVELPLVEYGQGYKDMSPALDGLEAALLNAKLAHGMNPVLTMCAANAVASQDPAGNRKLDKSKANGRIDGMVALAMALAVAEKGEEAVPLSPWEDPNFRMLG